MVSCLCIYIIVYVVMLLFLYLCYGLCIYVIISEFILSIFLTRGWVDDLAPTFPLVASYDMQERELGAFFVLPALSRPGLNTGASNLIVK